MTQDLTFGETRINYELSDTGRRWVWSILYEEGLCHTCPGFVTTDTGPLPSESKPQSTGSESEIFHYKFPSSTPIPDCIL